jgi:hypothetical protein
MVERMDQSSAIDREGMLDPLLAADPSFEPTWREFVAEWQSEAEGELPLYLALGDLARHLIAKLERGETADFAAVFDVVEQWHLRGDAYVREAATVGLLEDLQNTNLHRRTQPGDFEPWLRPESKRWWGKVERFWSDGELLTDD